MNVDVLAFLADCDAGGAQRTVINLVNNLDRHGLRPMLVLGRGDGPQRDFVGPDVEVVDLARPRLRQTPFPLRRLVAAIRPRLVFSTMAGANVVTAAAVLSLPHRPALVLRETNSHRARDNMSGLERRAAALAYGRADAVVALSEGVRQELVEDYRLDPARTVTVANPVEVEALRAAAAVATQAPWPPGGPVLVAVGRLVRQKGFDLLLEAFARLRMPELRLAILGEGPDRAALEAQAARLGVAGRVMMPGHVTQPAGWLAHAAAFVLSSRWEGFGHVVVEAMVCGAPVIATDCPHGPRDIVEPGLTGLLVPNGDVPALAEAMAGLLADPVRAAALRQAAATACERFSAATIAGRYASLFRRLIRHED